MSSGDFLCGVIEGFYGRPWSHETRTAYAAYLQQLGLNTYLYCPKADPFLRKRWQHDWPREEWEQLRRLGKCYREAGLWWGVGLSPYALYQEYGRRQQDQLRAKLAKLAVLEAPLLAILFDDMPGDRNDLAERQAAIVADVCRYAAGVRVLVCPTYYSFDPALEKYFGAMPARYRERLGQALPPEVDIFWTGNTVCSESISKQDIQAVAEELGRPIILWDNYPVNDGAVRSNFLYCQPLSNRESGMAPLLRGHLCNPMNQGLLSLPALTGLSTLYGLAGADEAVLAKALGPATWRQLRADREVFRSEGLSGLGPERRAALALRYDVLPGPAAGEVAGWLRGEYTFDPACLTD